MRTTKNNSHCESCGASDPNMDDGYTTCCNELACYGDGRNRFGIKTDNVVACCWSKAEQKFEAAGRAVPDGSARLN